jgi:RNA polymerase sigma factor (sigma-70 family)
MAKAMEPILSERTIHSVTDDLSESDDWPLALSGQGEAFGRIFDRHVGRVRRHSVRLVSQPADAEDVVAITFLEAWRSRARVRIVDGSVLPWLLVTATNVARNLERSTRRYRDLLSRLPVAELQLDRTDPAETEVTMALSSLSLIDRRVIVLCVLEGYSERDAASALGIPAGTVKSRLSRAKARLRSRLTQASHPSTLPQEVGNV